MATAETKYPVAWTIPVGALGESLPEGTTVDRALEAAVKLSGSFVSALQHPEEPLWWVFGDERMATVEPSRFGFMARPVSYTGISMHQLHAQLEALGWESALGQG